MIDIKFHCPTCDLDVPHFKKVNLWGAIVFGLWYALSYHFKKPECPLCGYVFNKKDQIPIVDGPLM